jgi:hypothetical protein
MFNLVIVFVKLDTLINILNVLDFSFFLDSMSIDKNSVILSKFSRRRLYLPVNNENMNDLIELCDHFQQSLNEKQKLFQIQREDVHHSINRTFNKIFEQLIEIRRFCRNDIEQQTLNTQVGYGLLT